MDQKQDLILQYLKPKKAITDDTTSIVDSVTAYDVSKVAAAGEYKLKSSGVVKSQVAVAVVVRKMMTLMLIKRMMTMMMMMMINNSELLLRFKSYLH